MFKTGTYTGDGVNPHAIVGVGFQPIVVFIYPQANLVSGDGTKATGDTDTFNFSTFGPAYFYGSPNIDSLDPDGFTVNGSRFNTNLRVYTYYCFGIGCGWKMATGTYTGDGNATQAIVGLGFQPKLVFIIHRVPNVDNMNTPCVKTDQDGLNAYLWSRAPSVGWRYTTDEIISLDADGFTVGDGTTLAVNDMNVLARDYTFVAFTE